MLHIYNPEPEGPIEQFLNMLMGVHPTKGESKAESDGYNNVDEDGDPNSSLPNAKQVY